MLDDKNNPNKEINKKIVNYSFDNVEIIGKRLGVDSKHIIAAIASLDNYKRFGRKR
jgi:hypothetical protein